MYHEKRTKIVATISDVNCGVEFLKELYEHGMNVVRINTAHQTYEGSKKVIENTRKVSNNIAILLDTKGPEVRTTHVKEGIEVRTNDMLTICGGPGKESTIDCLYVSYEDFVNEVPIGSNILIDDGTIELVAETKDEKGLHCKVLNSGFITSKRSVNVPSVKMDLSTLTPKDRDYIDFAIEQKIDFIAHSFVRKKEDVLEIQKILDEKGSTIKIIAKIENQEGVDNIDEILEHSYGIMVARGDLAVEVPKERIPFLQKAIIKKCIDVRKPVITATQMLHTMIQNPRPTRAEVSDVANAIYDGTDAIMLSGETAYGKYPLESLKTMKNIAVECEKNLPYYLGIDLAPINGIVAGYLCKKAVKAASRVNAEAILADTTTGRTIRNIAGYRGKKPVFAVCYNEHTIRHLALSFGVYPIHLNIPDSKGEFLQVGLAKLVKSEVLTKDSLMVLIAGNFNASNSGASFIEINTVTNLMSKISINYNIHDLLLSNL